MSCGPEGHDGILRYAAVTPARDELGNLSRLAGVMLVQTLRPDRWVIVDNESRDGTRELGATLAAAYPWVKLVSIPGAVRASRGGPIVRAFNAGVDLAGEVDVIVKLDADVSMTDDFFARLLLRFAD